MRRWSRLFVWEPISRHGTHRMTGALIRLRSIRYCSRCCNELAWCLRGMSLIILAMRCLCYGCFGEATVIPTMVVVARRRSPASCCSCADDQLGSFRPCVVERWLFERWCSGVELRGGFKSRCRSQAVESAETLSCSVAALGNHRTSIAYAQKCSHAVMANKNHRPRYHWSTMLFLCAKQRSSLWQQDHLHPMRQLKAKTTPTPGEEELFYKFYLVDKQLQMELRQKASFTVVRDRLQDALVNYQRSNRFKTWDTFRQPWLHHLLTIRALLS